MTPTFDLGLLAPGPLFTHWQPASLTYLALDVDGTTSTGGVQLADEVLAARARLKPTGLRVGAVTGRTWQHLSEIAERFHYDGPLVLHNGAEVWEEDRLLRRLTLGVDVTSEILAAARACHCHFEIFGGDEWFVSDVWHFTNKLLETEGMTSVPHPVPTEPFDATKATILVSTLAQLKQLESHLAHLDVELEPHVVPRDNSHSWVNVTAKGVTKGTGLTWIRERYGWKKENVLAVGDGPNDLTMLASAGTAIAMGQSSDVVKSHAHLIAPSVFDAGAAAAMDFAIQFALQ